MSSGERRMFALEIADDARLGAIAAEAALVDRELDVLESQLDSVDDVHAKLGVAFQIARAGRRSSGASLANLRRDLLAEGRDDEARVVRAALDVLALRPPERLERADRGYRWREDDVELYVEDPIAEHWHGQGRWGPPLRPDLERSPLWFGPEVGVDAALAAARDGQIVVVTFAPTSRLRGAPPALRLTRAGFARDAALTTERRWSTLRSLGWLELGAARMVALEPRGEPVAPLPARPSGGDEALMALIRGLLADGAGAPV